MEERDMKEVHKRNKTMNCKSAVKEQPKNIIKEEFEEKLKTKDINCNSPGKWYEESKHYHVEANEISNEELQKLRTQASSIFTETVLLNNSKQPKSLTKSDYAWVRTVLSKGTKTDKIAAYTLLIQESPLYNLTLLRNMVEMVRVGKNKECIMAIDTLCELFLNELLPPNRKLVSFVEQPLSKLDEITSGNVTSRRRKLFLWFYEEQLKSIYEDFINYLNKIAHDTVDANKEKVITAMCKLLEGHPERECLLLNNIVNKLGDPSHKVGSKVIYALTKLLETHPNMKEVVIDAVEKVIFRNNISKRAQYYSICFLSQFCLSIEDSKVAKKLISIYLSLFKACIKTGDIDSRMMSALLTGVKRAYPFAKEELGMLKEHINTIYKVVHLSHANIAIQALSLVYLVSDYSNAYLDRFYSVLYRKIGDVEMFKSSHHAMFLSLIFKALKRDKETPRICAFIKRILQICAYVPVPVSCGLLIMISELINLKKKVLLRESIPEHKVVVKLEYDSDDGEEHYKDLKEEEMPLKPKEEEEEEEEEEVEVKEEKHTNIQSNKLYNIKPLEEFKVWTNPDKSVGNAKDAQILNYDPFVRNPLYAGGDRSLCYELFKLSGHFHPTISLFANKIKNGERVVYSGDPLLDFTLIRFLDKFSFKNPKEIKTEEQKTLTFSKFGRKKYYSSSVVRRMRANTADYLNHSEKNIPVDEIFLYRYMKDKWEKGSQLKEDNSDVESVGSNEFDEMLSNIADGENDDINFMNEVGQLPKKTKKKDEDESGSEVEFDDGDEENDEDEDENENDNDNEVDEAESDGGSVAEDFEGNEIEDFGDDDDDVDMLGSDINEDELEAELEASGIKLPKLPKMKGAKNTFKNKKKWDSNKLFASAEEFSELLEETDVNAGGSEALSNKDRAAAKQLKWESDRDKWLHQKNFRSKNFKRPYKKMNHQKRKERKKKRF